MHTPSRTWIVVLCWLTVMFEGFDIVALGAIIPILTNPEIGHVGVTVADMTFVSTISLVGVAIGAVCIGPIADRRGRRLPLMGCVALFSLFTFIFPLMPNVALMGAVRLIAGFGLGACMPIAVTMMQESAPQGRKANASTVTMTGYHAGAVLASLAALVFHEHWHWLFYLGGGLGLLSLIPMWLKLPETAPPAIVGAAAAAKPTPAGPSLSVRDLFRDGRSRITVCLWVATFMGLMLVYGLNTWLPKIMELAGYNVSSSLVMLFVLNAGGIIGLLVGGRVADASGIKGTILVWFGVAAVLLAALSIRIADQVVLNGIILITGGFVFSAQVLVYAFVGYLYPKTLVATGMGFASGVGRMGAILGPLATGVLVTMSIAYPGGFYMFAAAALIGFLAVLSIPRPRASTSKELHALEQSEV
ncbi:MFS transporter [Brevibacterium jeotgali]|uniref:Predicted arabinose efflux permease, MFS family n=1 Tax=Brevibacterium jeotgali TaxID=1262550 RepID=A0A2H1L5H2_9MICO|nr:aromatic acid/H+ symport family MFS transporter [Brevibacterium jeotgali]TWC01372.1 putative MFS family arabinose efflux permease [Brevibacterium jeotgali]SMY12151.1 Predicted arabinose efflux permease, MFS family [Brevibacterium jeotgali]